MEKERLIFHVDVNSAFLSWEAAYRQHHLGGNLDLREIPSAVCGNVAMRHGIILAKSIPAKKYGIYTGMTVVEAKQRCPELYMVPPNYGLYEKCSRGFLKILREYSPEVEVYSIDEAFIDMTESKILFGDPRKAADGIRERIRQELGFTVNVGISTNKLLAKMAGELKKPDRTHTLYPWEIQEKMWPLPVEELFFAGRATTAKLHAMGIFTIGQLAGTDKAVLQYHLKHHGKVIWQFANGLDFSQVEDSPPPQKGYGNSTTMPFDVTDVSTGRLVLLALSETVAKRLREANAEAEVLSVGIKSASLHYKRHQMVLKSPTNITREIYEYACQLFEELWDKETPLRHMALHAGRLSYGTSLRQMQLFDDTDYVKLEKLDRAVDEIRRRYGIDAVKRAAFLPSGEEEKTTRRLDHMEGGISREKRSVDYTKLVID